MINWKYGSGQPWTKTESEKKKCKFMGRVSDAKQRLMDAVLELMWRGSYGTTTIDHICEKAGVKKGSFYYFFDSKADVAVTALDELYKEMRVELDGVFSPTVPPLERIRQYCDFVYKKQVEMLQECGFVLGCALCTLGTEVSTQEQALRAKIQEIMEHKAKYLDSALRDAHAAGAIHAPDAAAKGRVVRAYMEGVMTQARIQNNVELMREMAHGVFEVLGVEDAATTPI
jgi:TetR/AcrR family transcriptional repressor of nem operon